MSNLAKKVKGVQTRWVDFENIGAKKGGGGWENLGAKGHHTEVVNDGQTVTLMDYKGAGEIRRGVPTTVIFPCPLKPAQR